MALCRPLGWATRVRMKVGAEGGNDEPSSSRNTELGATVRRKVRRVQERVERMGPEGLEQRLRGPPVAAPYAWTSTVSALVEVGRAPALLAEVGRAGAQEGPRDVAQRAFGLIKAGADAVVVRCDEEDTPDGLADLTATVREVQSHPEFRRTPVLMKDWVVHPLQLADAVDCGAVGVIGAVCQVTSPKGTLTLSQYGTSRGLDMPIEVVNAAELKAMEQGGVTLYAFNTSIAITLSMPGFRQRLTEGLISALPFGSLSLVGVRNVDEARDARLAGADALLVAWSALEGMSQEQAQELFSDIRYACSMD